MAVAIEMEFEGATREQYDKTLELMGLEPQGAAPPNALFHWCEVTDSGLHVVDVWESREAFEKFAEEEIGPKTAEAGIESPPTMTFHEVHSYIGG